MKSRSVAERLDDPNEASGGSRSGRAVFALALAASLAVPAVSAAQSFERYTDAQRSYKVYVPSSYDPANDPVPLLVELHGCGGDGDEEARWSRFNDLAEAEGFLVAYPEQSPAANGSRCWNWFLPEHQSRGGGEPAIIAEITRRVVDRWNVDLRRVYVGGISAGGAMSVVMAVTHPDLYAAAMVYAGCEYKGTTCMAAVAAVPPEIAGRLAWEEMGERARVVPVIVIQGSADPLVPFPNAELVVQQFLATADWADDGENDGSIPRQRSATRLDQKPDGWFYEVDTYTDGTGCLLAERWLVHGLGHAWSNGTSNGSPRDTLFTDPRGPDVTTPVVRFLLSHPMPEQGIAHCVEDGS